MTEALVSCDKAEIRIVLLRHSTISFFFFLSISESLELCICKLINLREKFSTGPGFEPGSPALRAGAITTKSPRRSAGRRRNSSLIGYPLYPSGSTRSNKRRIPA